MEEMESDRAVSVPQRWNTHGREDHLPEAWLSSRVRCSGGSSDRSDRRLSVELNRSPWGAAPITTSGLADTPTWAPGCEVEPHGREDHLPETWLGSRAQCGGDSSDRCDRRLAVDPDRSSWAAAPIATSGLTDAPTWAPGLRRAGLGRSMNSGVTHVGVWRCGELTSSPPEGGGLMSAPADARWQGGALTRIDATASVLTATDRDRPRRYHAGFVLAPRRYAPPKASPEGEGVPPRGTLRSVVRADVATRDDFVHPAAWSKGDGVNRVFIGDTLIDEYDSPDRDLGPRNVVLVMLTQEPKIHLGHWERVRWTRSCRRGHVRNPCPPVTRGESVGTRRDPAAPGGHHRGSSRCRVTPTAVHFASNSTFHDHTGRNSGAPAPER